jgi:LacI family transcriptional regulator, galactose operon repressor
MRARPTMVDVAEMAGVSLKTVSRVVNDEPGVRAETAVRVRDAVTALRYRANDTARNLRRKRRPATVGLVIEDVRNPFYSSIARAVEELARLHGHVVVIANSDEDPAAEQKAVGTLLERQVTGLLIVPAGSDHGYLLDEIRHGTPVVFMDRPARDVKADEVLIDNVGGARHATDHLLAHGHRRIGLVGDPPTVYTVGERVRGFREAMAAAGAPVDESLIRLGRRDVAQAETATRELLSMAHPPTAVFTTNNRASIGVLRALRGRESTFALVGFDDFELADMLPVPVTVVKHDPAQMGRVATELLFGRLSGDERPPHRIVLPTRLVPRGSGEITGEPGP